MSRRSAGEGAAYRVPGGWKGSVEVPSGDGRRHRRYVTGPTKQAVTDKLVRLRAQVADGTLTLGPEMTVEAWLWHWWKVSTFKSQTRKGYASKIRVNIVPHIGGVRLDRLQPEHLEQLYARLSETLAPSTVHQCHAIIRRALRVAEQRRRVPRNVAALVSPPSVPHREAVALSREQAVAVLDAAAQRRSAPRWQVALAMGLRQGEALGLLWDAVDLAAGTLAVRTELVWLGYQHGCANPPACGIDSKPQMRARRCPKVSGGRYVLEEPKSARSRRVLPLPAQLVEPLKAWRKVQLEERLALGERYVGSGLGELVFAQPNGRPINARADWGDWQEILDAAGVPRVGTHAGRHTTATGLLEAGVPMRAVMEVLGHSQMAVTSDLYSHVGETMKRDAADAIGSWLFSAEQPRKQPRKRTGANAGDGKPGPKRL